MPVHNADIAAVFEEIADLLEIRGENPFRIRAYRNAARTVGALGLDLKALIDAGQALPKLPGIGADLEGKIREIVSTGASALLTHLHRQLPPAITELLKWPGLGPKRVKALHDSLKINTVEQLRRAAGAGLIRKLPGFGAKIETRVLEALAARPGPETRMRLAAWWLAPCTARSTCRAENRRRAF